MAVLTRPLTTPPRRGSGRCAIVWVRATSRSRYLLLRLLAVTQRVGVYIRSVSSVRPVRPGLRQLPLARALCDPRTVAISDAVPTCRASHTAWYRTEPV